MRIGIDVMGSDRSPQVLYEATLKAAAQFQEDVELFVIATDEYIRQFALKTHPNTVSFIHSSEVIDMRDEPLASIKNKKRSSLVTGIKLLKKKTIDAFVTAGNTGALIASSRLMLPSLPRIRRPALLAVLPTQTGKVAIIDVGGNVSCKAQHLISFAEMGVAYMQCLENVDLPKVGLLNIGIESKKGTLDLQEAYRILSSYPKNEFHFLGNVEARDVFKGQVDVLVTDGFTGNVLLKTSEGVANLVLESIKKNLSITDQNSFQSLQKYFNYTEYPGAIVLGIEGIVIKCHGEASPSAMFHSIKSAKNLVERNLLKKIKQKL